MRNMTIELNLITLPNKNIDRDELADRAQRLREDLIDAGAAKADFKSAGPPPAGARVAEPVTLGVLLVTFAASGGVFVTLIQAIRDYLLRNDQHSIVLKDANGPEIAIHGSPTPAEEKLIDAWRKQRLHE